MQLKEQRKKWDVLTNGDFSSLVIDSLCDQAGGLNTTVACFYFNFATQKEQSPASMLGSLLRQLVFGLEDTPEEVLRAYKDRKNAIGGPNFRYFEDATDYLFQKARVHMYRWSRRMCDRAPSQDSRFARSNPPTLSSYSNIRDRKTAYSA